MKVSVCVWVIDGSVVLVAVTVNESWVPGGGIGWPGSAPGRCRGFPFRRRDVTLVLAVEDREAGGDVREREVVGVGGRAEVLDRGAEGGGKTAPVEGHGELGVGRDGEVDPGLCRRDRHLDGRLRLEVGVGLRLGDDLDRVGAALDARRGRAR